MSDCTCHERTAGICDLCREGSFGRYLRESLNRLAELRRREEEIESLTKTIANRDDAVEHLARRAEAAEKARDQWKDRAGQTALSLRALKKRVAELEREIATVRAAETTEAQLRRREEEIEEHLARHAEVAEKRAAELEK